MYYYIKGTLALKGENYAVVDASGVGYKFNVSSTFMENSAPVGTDITVYTYLSVREDAMELYGFYSEDEREMFLKLISVSGVGPKVALSVLSVGAPQKIAAAIVTADEKFLTKASGVGAKAAKRIILELKDKIDNSQLGISDEGLVATDSNEVITDSRAEAMSALTVLGYSAQEAKNVLLKLDPSLCTEELIKQALSKLM